MEITITLKTLFAIGVCLFPVVATLHALGANYKELHKLPLLILKGIKYAALGVAWYIRGIWEDESHDGKLSFMGYTLLATIALVSYPLLVHLSYNDSLAGFLHDNAVPAWALITSLFSLAFSLVTTVILFIIPTMERKK